MADSNIRELCKKEWVNEMDNVIQMNETGINEKVDTLDKIVRNSIEDVLKKRVKKELRRNFMTREILIFEGIIEQRWYMDECKWYEK